MLPPSEDNSPLAGECNDASPCKTTSVRTTPVVATDPGPLIVLPPIPLLPPVAPRQAEAIAPLPNARAGAIPKSPMPTSIHRSKRASPSMLGTMSRLRMGRAYSWLDLKKSKNALAYRPRGLNPSITKPFNRSSKTSHLNERNRAKSGASLLDHVQRRGTPRRRRPSNTVDAGH